MKRKEQKFKKLRFEKTTIAKLNCEQQKLLFGGKCNNTLNLPSLIVEGDTDNCTGIPTITDLTITDSY